MKRLFYFSLLILLITISSLLAAPPVTLAILDFQNTSNLQELNYLEKAIPQLLITNLMGSQKIILIERSQLEKLIEEHQLNQSGAIDEKTATRIGKLSGANHLLLGTIFKSNDQIRIDARVLETQSGRILFAEKVVTSENSDLIDTIDELGRIILERLANETIQPPQDPSGEFQPIAGEVLSISASLDNSYKLTGSQEATYLLVNFKAGQMKKQQDRIPLNICMVIDKSGSMESENKLENVKKAALFVIDNLKPTDFFSVITYDTHVYSTIPAARVYNKTELRAIMERIVTGSSTNLSGGMMEGYAQVLKNFKSGMVNRVLLLSDGLANAGITNPLQLKKIATEKNNQGLTLSTFGVGTDFNEDLMTTLAEFGGGNYYFISNPDDISTIFSQELLGLLSVVAQNVEIDFQPAPTVQLVQTFGYQAQQTGNQITVKLNDIFSEEEKTVLFKLKVPGETAADFRIGSLKVVYDDVILKNERIEKSFSPVLTFTTDKSLFATGSNQLVKENIALFESALMLDEAITNVDQRKFDKAKSINSLNLSFLQQQLAHNSSKRLKQQVLDVMKYESETKKAEKYDVQEMNEFQKDAKFQNYLQRKKR